MTLSATFGVFLMPWLLAAAAAQQLQRFMQHPRRTRLFRLFKTHAAWTARFLAAPTVLGVADSYGIELIHPMREV